MNSQDKKEIVEMMGGVLEDIVLPRFQGIEDDIVDIKETQNIHTDKLDNIERRLDSEADKRGELESTVRNHEKRLTKVEAKVA